ncbi:CocE/NonD family hydrolase [Pigmentiphaga litoralis]|uniref:CocE/NonD family hydrolase n=1 Tax=Pigmentiphaga litoralis TaxID=516702 RepID=UPI00389A3904
MTTRSTMTWRPKYVPFRGALATVLLTALLAACGGDSDDSPRTDDVGAVGAGTQSRSWVEGPGTLLTSTERFAIKTDSVTIPMRDGIRVDARLLLPQGVQDGPRPCVLMANGYGIDTPGLESQVLEMAARGYAGVHASLRGSGKSQGTLGLYDNFGPDGYDIVQWMAGQPWCNGKVGMIGASLLGIVQWQTARQAPPALKAIIPHVACGDCYDVLWYPGGMLPGPGRRARAGIEFDLASQHRNYDAFWQERTTLDADHKKIGQSGLGVMITGGWNDYISPASIKAYEDLPATAKKMLVVGPSAHGTAIADLAPFSYGEQQALWLDRYLRDLDRGDAARGRALLYVQGPNKWRYEKDWPLPDEQRVRLYLNAAKSGSINSVNDGLIVAQAPAAGDSFASAKVTYSPSAGPFLHTLLSATNGRSTEDMHAIQQKVLTWSSAPLTVSTEVTGHGKLNFWAQLKGADPDFVVEVSDVAPDGSARQVTAGYLNAARAKSRAAPAAVPQDTPTQYEVNIWPTSYVFKAGHRLRISVAGGTEETAGLVGPQGPGKNPTASEISLLQGSKYPSYVELPLIGTGWIDR